MLKKIKKITANPKHAKLMHWGKLISITGSSQLLIQAIGFFSGVLVIRLLPTQEYALYTIANTMLGTMTILSNAGISNGVMAEGGKVWKDKKQLGTVLATGMDLRRKFAIGSLIISIPILIYLLLHNNASWLMAIMIVLSLIPAFFAALSDSLLEIVPKLHQSIVPLQKNMINVSAGRLILSAISLFIFPWTFVAILASGIPRIYGNIQLRKISANFIESNQNPDPKVRKDILKIVKRILPNAIYFSLSGQITIWIISLFGNTTSVAELGALGRVAIIFTLFSTLIGTLIVPRFSRLEHKKSLLIRYYTQVLIASSLLIFFVGSFGSFFSNQLLWILGSKYSSLNFEMILNIITACLSVLSGIAFSLYASRGWAIPPLIPMVKNFIVIVVSCFVFDLSTLIGVLYMNLFLIFSSMLMNVLYGYYNLYKIKE